MGNLLIQQSTKNLPRFVRLADAVVHFDANLIVNDGREVRVTPKAMAVLRMLASRPFDPVSRQELLDSVWAETCPTDEVVTQAIAELRRALEDHSRDARVIETVPRVGYRLRVAVEAAESAVVLPMRASSSSAAGASASLVLVGGRTPMAAVPRATSDAQPVNRNSPVAEGPMDGPTRVGDDAADEPSLAALAPRTAAESPLPTLSSAGAPDHAASVASVTTDRQDRVLSMRNLAIAALLLIALAASVWRTAQRGNATPTPDHAAPAMAGNSRSSLLTADPAYESFPALSPDGSTVAFSRMATEKDSRIVLRGLDAASGILPITDPGEAMDGHPVWSPDGKYIAFHRVGKQGCDLMVVGATGGAARTVGHCGATYVDYFDWMPNGKGLLLSRHQDCNSPSGKCTRLTVLDLESGSLRALSQTDADTPESDLQPKVSPDGRWVAFRRGVAPFSDLYLLPLAGGTARQLTHIAANIRGMAWYPDSAHLLFSSDHEGAQSLYRLDTAEAKIQALGVSGATFPTVARQADVAAYVGGAMRTRLLEIDAAGNDPGKPVLAESTRSDAAPVVAPDGATLVFLSDRSGHFELWLHRFATAETVPLTRLESGALQNPQWSPDSGSVLIVHRDRGLSRLLEVDVATGRVRVLGSETERIRFGSYSSDGKSIYVSSYRGGDWRIWRWSRDGKSAQLIGGGGAVNPMDLGQPQSLYYINERLGGLYRIDLSEAATGDGCMVSREPDLLGRGNLERQGEWMYYASSRASRSHYLRMRMADLSCDNPGTATEDLRELNPGSDQIQLSMRPDAQRAIIAAPDRDETDLYSLSLR